MSSDGETVKAVLKVEEERCRAITANDWAALDKILGEDYTYTHSSGYTENKKDWMVGLAKEPRVMTRENLVVRPLGDVALLQGRMILDVTPPNGERYGRDLDVLQVWVKRDGAWKLIANHGVSNTHTV